MSLSKAPFCVTCLKTDEEVAIKTCQGCKIITYCSRACQKANLERHDEVCKNIKYFDTVWKRGKAGLTRRNPHIDEYERKCFLTKIFTSEEESEVDKRVARIYWYRNVLTLAMTHDHYRALEIYVEMFNEFPEKGHVSVGDTSDDEDDSDDQDDSDDDGEDKQEPGVYAEIISHYLELGRLKEAEALFEEAMRVSDEITPKLLVSGLALGFVFLDEIKKKSERLDAFMDVLDRAPPGSSAHRFGNIDFLVENIQKMVFGDVYQAWKSNKTEYKIQRAIEVLVRDEPRIYHALWDRKRIDCGHPYCMDEEKFDVQLVAYGKRIIHRIPWAVEYLRNYTDSDSDFDIDSPLDSDSSDD